MGTGLYILWERHLRSLPGSIALIVAGSLAVAYSVYVHGHPDAPNAPAWVVLLLVTWAVLGYLIYLRVKYGPTVLQPSEQSMADARKQWQAEFEQQQNAKQKLATALSAEDVLLSGLSDTEYRLYQGVKANFTNLHWSQKIALKRICGVGTVELDGIKDGLEADGLAHPDWIIQELVTKGFLERNIGILSLPVAKAKWIEILFEGVRLC